MDMLTAKAVGYLIFIKENDRMVYETDIFSVEKCNKYTDRLFIFGDNLQGYGKKGQAIIRDCHNAIGIPTKKYPSMSKDSFFYDEDITEFKKEVDNAIARIKSSNYSSLVLPSAGLGTGLARLKETSDLCFKYLNNAIDRLIEDYSK